jgi:hypothetical protein
MELGEDVGPGVIAEQGHDPDCYFCNAKDEPTVEENDLTDNLEEDALEGSLTEVKFKNDSGTLGAAIGGDQGKRTVKLSGTKAGKTLEVSVAAHHLIPGNASLAKSTLFLSEEYLWKDKKVKGNIGYNVNSAPNGVWLPGNYAARPWGTEGVAFVKEFGPSAQEYAYAAIEAWRAQFHDAHEKYSVFVKDVLDKIYDKLENTEDLWCPEAKSKKDKKPDERPPLYVLVARLNTVSSRMRRMLVAPSDKWKKNIWTSRFSLSYMNDKTTHIQP